MIQCKRTPNVKVLLVMMHLMCKKHITIKLVMVDITVDVHV